MAARTIVQKPRMSFWQIWNMSFGFLGIQFGFALQTGYASSILLKFGAKVDNLSWFWLACTAHWYDHPAHHRPLQRSYLEQAWPKAPLFFNRCAYSQALALMFSAKFIRAGIPYSANYCWGRDAHGYGCFV